MESNCWTSSGEEETEQESVDLGVGRSYECVFCKRGFNTAQALGGHMNIHRKDRVKNKPNSTKQEQEQQQHLISPPGIYQYNHINLPPQDQIFAYFPVSATAPPGIGALYGGYPHHHQFLSVDSDHDDPRQIKPLLNDPEVPVGDNWSLMSLRFVEDLEREKNPEEELDLELRLGYDS